MSDREELVRALEAVADRDEVRLERSVFRARGRQADVRKKLRAVVASIEEVRSNSIGMRALGHRASELVVPELCLETHRDRQLDLREDAAKARRWATTTMRKELERFERDLIYLEAICDEVVGDLQASGPNMAIKSTRTKRRERVLAPTAQEPAKVSAQVIRTLEFESPKRQASRMKMAVEIDLQSASNFFTGFSENLSDGGVFVATERNLDVGSEVDLAFSVPEPGKAGNMINIHAQALVRWARTPCEESDPVGGLGLEFVGLSEIAHDAIRAFMGDRAPIFYPG